MTFTLPTRAALKEHQRRQLEDGYSFELTATSLGMAEVIKAHVRRLNTTDRASIEMLPTAIQETVWKGMKAFEKEQKAAIAAGQTAPESLQEAVLSNQRILPAANALCIAAFIEPPLVATEAELDQKPGAYVVDDIAAEDRISFLMACMDADSESAKKLKTFRPAPTQHVPASGPVAVAPTPIGPDGAA